MTARQVHGAFGKVPARPVYAKADRELERERIREAVAIAYSYDEVLQLGEMFRRQRARAEEIADLFAEYSRYEDVEELCYMAYQWRLALKRERRRSSPPGKSRALEKQLRRDYKAYYQALIADPVRCARRRKTDKERYRRRRADPATLEHMRKQGRETARKFKDKRKAAHRAWQQRIRRERSAVYLKRLAYSCERVRRDYQDPERREARRKACRECMRRKRARLKANAPAYRAYLDERNARRASRAKQAGRPYRSASPRWRPRELRRAA